MSEQITINLTTSVQNSFRVQQIGGLFDVPIEQKMSKKILIDPPPAQEEDWKIGLIVGPSGSGKSSTAKMLYSAELYQGFSWSSTKAIVDQFDTPEIKKIIKALNIVGFSSPPSWLKPYSVLSNGEKFRCDLAKALLDSSGDLVVFDEYTSVVDRTVAKVCSAAVAKGLKEDFIRKKFIAVTCHYDIADWLEPDWILDLATGKVARRSLRRPDIKLDIVRVPQSLWTLFAKHHYLSGSLGTNSRCFAAFWEGTPVAFAALLPLLGFKKRRRISRIVVLPDYQGAGIGSAFVNTMGDLCREEGYRLNITTSHPAMIRHCEKSPFWRTISVRKGISSSCQFGKKYVGSAGRAVVSFEYTADRTGDPCNSGRVSSH
ncbi:MAG: GNAT family N-acetyltransferase [Planctomycetia bacterium]|nr:GNAT family N-acetyltransferase [Planctomycetia bacterium]